MALPASDIGGETPDYAGKVIVNGKPYAAGLSWFKADKADQVRAEARTFAVDGGGDFFCAIDKPVAQFAVGFKSKGHAAGQRPLAYAAASRADGGDFIGAFAVNGGWWFGIAEGGLVRSGTDLLFEREEDCRRKFEEELQTVSETLPAFAPESWQIDGTEPLEIEEAIDAIPTVTLRALESPLAQVRSLVLLVIVLLMAAGGGIYYFLQQAAERNAVIEANNRAYQAAIRNERPWIREPVPSLVVNGCHQAFNRLPIVVPGWAMSGASCLQTPGNPLVRQAQASWDLGDGFLQALVVAAQATQFTPQIGNDGESAILSATVNLPATRLQAGRDTPYMGLWPGARVQQVLWELENRLSVEGAEAVDIDIQGSPPTGRRQPATDSEGQPFDDVYRPPPTMGVRIVSSLPLRSWNRVLDAIPGMIVDNIDWNTQNGDWTINARVFVKFSGDA